MVRFNRARAFSALIRHNGEDIPLEMQITYVSNWLDKIARDKRFMVRSLHTLDDRPPSFNMELWEALGGRSGYMSTFRPDSDWFHSNYKECTDNLAKYKSKGANFAVIRLEDFFSDDHRMIALKLDQSSTGGWLNFSYPCAMFDPHVGLGMYSNHTDLTFDLCTLLQHYSFSSSRTYILQASGID